MRYNLWNITLDRWVPCDSYKIAIKDKNKSKSLTLKQAKVRLTSIKIWTRKAGFYHAYEIKKWIESCQQDCCKNK